MKGFLAPGLFKNIKRSIADSVSVNELDVRDPLLKEKILKFYGASPIKLWALKESLRSRWDSIDEGDYVLFYHAGKFIYAGKVSFKYPFVESPKQVEAGLKNLAAGPKLRTDISFRDLAEFLKMNQNWDLIEGANRYTFRNILDTFYTVTSAPLTTRYAIEQAIKRGVEIFNVGILMEGKF